MLANWVDRRGRSRGTSGSAAGCADDCDALVVQREVLDPAAYVELWLKDAGLHGGADYLERYDTWLSWFDEQGIEGVGFGWINLRAVGGRQRRRTTSWSGRMPWSSRSRPAIARLGRRGRRAARPRRRRPADDPLSGAPT